MPENATPLIPRKVLFGNPEKAMTRLSPDGRYLSYLAPLDGVLNVWVAPVENLGAARPVTADKVRGIRFYEWAFTNQHILYLQDKGGDENWRLYSVDLASGQERDLTPYEKVSARLQQLSPEFPSEALVALNDRNEQLHDLYRLQLSTGERTLVEQNEAGFLEYTTDRRFQVLLASAMTPDGGMAVHRRGADGQWAPFLQIGMEDTLTTSPVGFDGRSENLYLLDSRGRNTAALFKLNMASGAAVLLAEDGRSDADGALVHPATHEVQAVRFNYERVSWQVLDPAIQPDLDYLRGVADGDLEVISRTLDDRFWIVAYLMDNGPVRYYRYDRGQRQAVYLFSNRSDLESYALARMHSAVVRTRDGLDMVCYYTLPVGSDAAQPGRPQRPLATVLFVHGGPWGRDAWGFNPYHQWWANRGYAVLSVNFRGSTGFGKDFTNAGNLEWGAKMHDDLLDALAWAMGAGIAAQDQVAIAGGSYGGYATLAGLTFTPDVFACGVDIVGPSNIITLLETIPPYWAPMVNMFTSRVGDFRTEEGKAFLAQRSPVNFADRIRRPLLIGQGANDPRVKQAESDQIVKAMQSKDIPVSYVLFPDEGHGFARPENNLAFNAITELFLARILEGRWEPVGADFAGSSVQVLAGAEQVPGLPAALAAHAAKS